MEFFDVCLLKWLFCMSAGCQNLGEHLKTINKEQLEAAS